MIQRKQSIFILVSLLLMGGLIAFPIETYSSIKGLTELHWNGLYDVTPGAVEPLISRLVSLAILIILPMVLNFVGLFLYKHRRVQMRFIGIASGIEILLTGILIYLSVEISGTMESEWYFNIHWLLPVAAAVMDFLAYRRIAADEAVIQSLNRLR